MLEQSKFNKKEYIKNSLEILALKSKYIVKSPRGTVILNELQYKILNLFEEPCDFESILKINANLNGETLVNLLNIFISEKLIVNVDSKAIQRNTLGYYFRRLTRINIPSKFLSRICIYLSKVNTSILTPIAIVAIFLSLYTNYKLIIYTNFSWSNSPRIIEFFLIGLFLALIHELILGAHIVKSEGIIELKFKIRVLLGVFISIVINWEYLLLKSKKERIYTFLKVDLYTGFVCAIFSIIGYILMLVNYERGAFMFCSFSIIGYSYLLINLWPFLLKGDGYNIYCFITNTGRVRSTFFKIILYPYYKIKNRRLLFQGNIIFYLLWGAMFIGTIIFLEYCLSNGIRLRI